MNPTKGRARRVPAPLSKALPGAPGLRRRDLVQRRVDLLAVREPSLRLLREDQLPVVGNLEYPAAARDQRDASREVERSGVDQMLRQTGGALVIPSGCAELDLHRRGRILAGHEASPCVATRREPDRIEWFVASWYQQRPECTMPRRLRAPGHRCGFSGDVAQPAASIISTILAGSGNFHSSGVFS